MKEYYLGLLSGFRMYLPMIPTIMINKKFDTDDTKEAPTCIRFAYKIVYEIDPHAVYISGLV